MKRKVNKKEKLALELLSDIEYYKSNLKASCDALNEMIPDLRKIKSRKIRVVDNFKKKNVVYRTTSVQRFTIERI